LASKIQILQENILRLARRGAHAHIRRMLLKSHPAEIVAVVRQAPADLALVLMEQLRHSVIEPKVFAELGSAFLATYLAKRDDKAHIADVLQQLPEDDAAHLLSDLSSADEILTLMRGTSREEVAEILQYEEGSCGRIMSVNVFALNQNLTARDTIEEIQKSSSPESLFYLYAVDDFENLVGVVSLRQILQVEGARRLKDFMTSDVVRVNVYSSRDEAARLVEEYDFVSVPVVDDKGRLVGMVTVDDAIDTIREAANDDVLQMAGVEAEAIEDFSYWRAALTRARWFGLLLLCGIIVSELIHAFLAGQVQALALGFGFLPLAIRLGSSTANQFITVIQQGIIETDIERSRAIKAVWGQALVTGSALVALTLAASGFATWRYQSFPLAGLPLALGLLFVAIVSSLLGVLVPFVFKRLKLNALQASSRFFFFLDILTCYIFLSCVWVCSPS
jgi:magnesium transporter